MGCVWNRMDMDDLSVQELLTMRDAVNAALAKKPFSEWSDASTDAVSDEKQGVVNLSPHVRYFKDSQMEYNNETHGLIFWPPVVVTEATSRELNPKYQLDRTGVMGVIAKTGAIPAKRIEKKLLLVNEALCPLVFVVSSDPHAQQFGSGRVNAGTGGAELGVKFTRREVINQILVIRPKSRSEVLCRTGHAYITVARQKSCGRYAVYRYRREVGMGETYTATNGMVAGVESDVRPSTFLEEFK